MNICTENVFWDLATLIAGSVCKQSTLYCFKCSNFSQCYAGLTVAIFCSLIDGNPISGKIPGFIGNWTQITRL